MFKHLRLRGFYLFNVFSEPQPLQIPSIEPCTSGEEQGAPPPPPHPGLCSQLQSVGSRLYQTRRGSLDQNPVISPCSSGWDVYQVLAVGDAYCGSEVSLYL